VKKYGESFALTCARRTASFGGDDWFNVTSGGMTVKVIISQDLSGGSSSYSSSSGSDSDYKPKREPKPTRKKSQSMGGGGLYVSDFGGGISWNENGQKMEMAMPYDGGGFFLFWDWVYLEWFCGLHWGGGDWEKDGVTSGGLPEMSRTYGFYGVFGKFPVIGIGPSVTIFPLYGIDYDAFRYDSTSANLKYSGKEDVFFDGKDGRPPKKSLSALWGKFGGGIDIGTGDNSMYFFLRIEALYGIRLSANDFEKHYAVDYVDTDGNYTKPISGRGLTVRVSLGFQ